MLKPTSSYKMARKDTTAEAFERSFERNPTLFPLLRDIVHWDNWHCKFVTQARLQGCKKILDDSYAPSTIEEEILFSKQNLYMYAVFAKILKIDVGYDLLLEYRDDHNAQDVYVGLKKFVAGTKIQKCIRQCYLHRRWKRLTESAFDRRLRMLVDSTITLQRYVRGFHV